MEPLGGNWISRTLSSEGEPRVEILEWRRGGGRDVLFRSIQYLHFKHCSRPSDSCSHAAAEGNQGLVSLVVL